MSTVRMRPRARITYLLAVLAFAVAAGLSGPPALKAATPPASYYGMAGAGDTIDARYNGIVCAGTVTGADGFWAFQVPSGGTCGVSAGDSLAFFRNGADTGVREPFRPGGVPANVSSGVNVGAGTLSPVPATPGSPGPAAFIGSVRGPGGSALLVTAREVTLEVLRSALRSSGCELQVLAVLRGGEWSVYIEGAPAAVNSAFPASLPQTTAFFVRC